MSTIVIRIVPTEGGHKVKATSVGLELLSERIYNREGNARKAARRLVEALNHASVGGELVADLKA